MAVIRVEAYTAGGRLTWENISDFYRDSATSMRFCDENGNCIYLVNMPTVYTAVKNTEKENTND